MASGEQGGRILVEVAYARRDQQVIVELEVANGATTGGAIKASGILERYPEIDLEVNQVGVFGKLAGLDRPLRDRDRVEIYRPLSADPKESRRRRVVAAKGGKQRGP
jgi:putative ubiquitin-RnfH superfamily antitoxin RatB of RatAB toxin-antitoxin module